VFQSLKDGQFKGVMAQRIPQLTMENHKCNVLHEPKYTSKAIFLFQILLLKKEAWPYFQILKNK
jgi:hypothetical protein